MMNRGKSSSSMKSKDLRTYSSYSASKKPTPTTSMKPTPTMTPKRSNATMGQNQLGQILITPAKYKERQKSDAKISKTAIKQYKPLIH